MFGHPGSAPGGAPAIPGGESRGGGCCATNRSMVTVVEPAGFAQALREWRERRRVSQLELALRAGTTQRHVSFIERGRSLPGRGMVVRLAQRSWHHDEHELDTDSPTRRRDAMASIRRHIVID